MGITEDYCSYEVAKLLDKKGFREYCEAIYFILENGDYRWSKIDIPIRDCSTCKPAAILCPSHQMAMKWLRKEHNICIAPYAAAYRYGFTIDKCDTGSNICNDDVIDEELTTYEKAVEAALEYCLTELI